MILLSSLAMAASWPGDDDFVLPALSAELYRPAVDGLGLTVERADGEGGAVADLVWAHRPLVFRRDSGEVVELVGDLVGAHVGAAGLAGPVRVEGQLPVYLLASGDLGSGAAVGDAALGLSVPLAAGPVALAPLARVGVPLGGDIWALGAGAWAGDLGFRASWRGPLELGLDTGLTLVPGEDAANVAVGHNAWLRAGLAYGRDAWRASLETSLKTPLDAFFVADGNTPVEVLLGGGWKSLRAGLGAGVLPGVGSPSWRLVLGAQL